MFFVYETEMKKGFWPGPYTKFIDRSDDSIGIHITRPHEQPWYVKKGEEMIGSAAYKPPVGMTVGEAREKLKMLTTPPQGALSMPLHEARRVYGKLTPLELDSETLQPSLQSLQPPQPTTTPESEPQTTAETQASFESPYQWLHTQPKVTPTPTSSSDGQ